MKKKIGIIVAMLIVAVLAITTIVLAFVNVNNAPTFLNPYEIRAYEAGNSRPVFGVTDNEDDENLKAKYNEFLTKYNKMFSTTLLSSIFSGNGGVEVKDLFKSQPSTTGNKVILDYSKEPMPLKINGKDYYSNYMPDEIYKVTDITFEIYPEDSYREIKMYLRKEVQKNSITTNYYLEVTTKANTHELYEMLYGKVEEE